MKSSKVLTIESSLTSECDCVSKALAQVSSASSKQKWKYGPKDVSIT